MTEILFDSKFKAISATAGEDLKAGTIVSGKLFTQDSSEPVTADIATPEGVTLYAAKKGHPVAVVYVGSVKQEELANYDDTVDALLPNIKIIKTK